MKKDMSVVTKDEVQSFLDMFHAKMKIYGIIYRDDRGKNQKALEGRQFAFLFIWQNGR